MSIFTATTTASRSVWQSPDLARQIFEVMLDVNGQPMKASTFSEIIAEVGWGGQLESYEKEGKKGAQTFVRQAPKEDGGHSGATQGVAPARSSYQPKDEAAIKAMFAIKTAVMWLTDSTPDPNDVGVIEPLAKDIFAMVDRVKASENAPQVPAEPAPEMPEDFLKDDPWPN